jgi:hypothetical protein
MDEKPINKYISDLSDSIIAQADNKNNLVFPEIETTILSPMFRGKRPILPPEQKKMGFIEASFEHARNFNTIASGSTYITNKVIPDDAAMDFSSDEIPDDWNRFNEEILEGTPQNYWNYILEGQSPREQAYRRMKALEEIERERQLADAGWLPAIVGGIVGFATDPIAWALPQIAAVKYAVTARAAYAALTKVAPKVAVQAATTNAFIQLNRIGGNAEDFALNTLIDTTFGTALWGGGQAVGRAFRGANAWSARNVVKASYEGIDVLPRINAKTGVYEGLEAVVSSDTSAGAAARDLAQKFLDEGAVLQGLSSWIGPLNKIPGIGSPLVQGLTSTSATVRAWANGLANVSFVTGAIARGEPRQITASEILREINNEGRAVATRLHELYIESIGLKPGLVGSAKSIVRQFQEGVAASRSQFNDDITRAVLTGVAHETAAVNEGAQILTNHLEKIWKQYLKVNDLPDDVFSPRTAMGYLMRMYNQPEMIRNHGRFIDTVTRALRTQDEQIVRLKQPIETLVAENKQLNKLLTTPGVTDAQARNARNTIARNGRKLKKLEAQLNKDIADGIIDSALLDARSWMTNTERESLRKTLGPINKLKEQIANAEEDLQKITINQRKSAADKIKDMKNQLEDLRTQFAIDAQEGRISKKLWVKNDEGHIIPRDPDELPKFRPTYDDDLARQEAADIYYNRILQSTPEQINQNIFNHISGSQTPDPAKGRTLLIPDIDLFNAGFLSNDLSKMIGVYSSVLGKRIGLKTRFADVDWLDGIEGISESLAQENQVKRATIMKNIPEGKKRNKALDKQDRENKEHQDYIKKSYAVFMGNYATTDAYYSFGKAVRNMSAITSLGNVPLLQTGEIFGVAFKQGIWPWITAGAIPLIKSINPFVKNKTYRRNASHALVGMELELSNYSNYLYETNAMEHQPGNAFLKGIDIAARITPITNMTNFMTNFLQRFSANVTQSRVMSDLFKAADGKLGLAGQRRLLINGIDPKDAQKFIDQYNAHGGHSLHGGHVSNWYLWSDAKLQQQMKRAIMNDVQGSIVEGGILDKPFWTNKPIIGLPFQFMGYPYATFNRFIAPIFQTPDGNKIMGMILMSAMGALYEPMRAWQKGEEFQFDDDKSFDQWMVSSALASGALGWPAEALQIIDGFFQPEILDRYMQKKFRRRTLAGVLLGPAGGMGQNMLDVLQMFGEGKLNQQDVLKLKKITPLPGNLILGKFINDVIKNSDLPENSSGSDSWWEV